VRSRFTARQTAAKFRVVCSPTTKKYRACISALVSDTDSVLVVCAENSEGDVAAAVAAAGGRSLTARAGTQYRSSNSSGRQLREDLTLCASTYRCAVTRLWRTGTRCLKCCRVSLNLPCTQCWSSPRHLSVTHVPGTTAIA
jgi:hypothetical protein